MGQQRIAVRSTRVPRGPVIMPVAQELAIMRAPRIRAVSITRVPAGPVSRIIRLPRVILRLRITRRPRVIRRAAARVIPRLRVIRLLAVVGKRRAAVVVERSLRPVIRPRQRNSIREAGEESGLPSGGPLFVFMASFFGYAQSRTRLWITERRTRLRLLRRMSLS